MIPASTPAATLAAAHLECDAITRAAARNFHYGIRLLPPAKRHAMTAVYALARRIDDIGDGDLPLADKHAQLATVRADLAAARAGADVSGDPVLVALDDAAREFGLPMAAFDELIVGVEHDLVGTVYQTFDDLVGYCRCVAGSIGRLCVAVFGTHSELAAQRADALGIALQQTNILRDIREDLITGRSYLPAAELAQFGVELRLDGAGRLSDPDGGLAELIRVAAVRNLEWYDEGLKLLPMLDRRSAACVTAMAGIYRRLLGRILADPSAVFDRRLSLSGREKAAVAARAMTRPFAAAMVAT